MVIFAEFTEKRQIEDFKLEMFDKGFEDSQILWMNECWLCPKGQYVNPFPITKLNVKRLQFSNFDRMTLYMASDCSLGNSFYEISF